MGRGLSFAPGEFYHLYGRGVDKRRVFLSLYDYRRFEGMLYACNQERRIEAREFAWNEVFTSARNKPLVSIGAWCLMPNHFHLVAQERIAGGISLFMQKMMTGYTMYFNARSNRTGSLFESTFKSRHVDSDEYLRYLIAYVHLNPIKLIDSKWKENGIQDRMHAEEYLSHYMHSSYQDYIGEQRPQRALLDMSMLPDYFETPTDFKKHVTEWLNQDPFRPEV